MFRLNNVLMQIEPQLSNSIKVGSAESNKFQQLFTQIARGFDPENPPSNVILYQEAASLYERGEYISAEQVLKDALSAAKKEESADEVIQLYEYQLLKTQNAIKSSKNTRNWLKTALTVASSVSIGFYFGSRKADILAP